MELSQSAEIADDIRGQSASAVMLSIGIEPIQSAAGETGIEVQLSFLDVALEPTPNHTVRISIVASATAGKVLAVPLSSIYSRTDGTTFVTIDSEGATRDVTVRTGISGGGWIEIISSTEDALRAGSLVVVGEDAGN